MLMSARNKIISTEDRAMQLGNIIFCIVLSLIAKPAFSQKYDAEVTNITVWVKATDSTIKPVRGLTQNDFHIYEDDREVEITCFEEVTLSKGQSAEIQKVDPEKAQSDQTFVQSSSKRIVIFLDLYNTSPSEYITLKPRLFEFLEQIAERKWMVMVAVHAAGRVSILVPYTKDYSWIRTSLNKMMGNPTRDQAISNRKRQISLIVNSRLPMEEVLRQTASLARQYLREEKNETLKSLDALDAVGRYVSKHSENDHTVIIFVSGGINSEPGRPYYQVLEKFLDSAQDTTDLYFRYPQLIQEKNFDVLQEIRKRIGSMNRENMTLYALNTRGAINPSFSDNIFEQSDDAVVNDDAGLQVFQEVMDQIAIDTGGTSFKNSFDFSKGFENIMVDLQHQYLLCYSAPLREQQGKYRKISVKTSKSGVHLRHRSGYVN